VTVSSGSATAFFTINTSPVGSSTSVDVEASYASVDRHASLVVVNYTVQGIAPSGTLLAGGGRPLLLASLFLARSIGSGATSFHWSDTNMSQFRLNLGYEGETALEADSENPTPDRMPVTLAASFPGPPKRNFIYSPEMNLLAESELARPREKAIIYEYIWFNGHPVAQIDSGVVTHWTFTDHLGTLLIQTTESQAVWWRAEYEPYGRAFTYNPIGLADQHQPLRLPGQEAEQLNLGPNGVTERSYNIFRSYRPNWGRYTQPDPAWDPTQISELNPYLYARANPLTSIDRLGLVSWKCDYKASTVNQPILGVGAGGIVSGCVSECACGKKLAVVIAAGILGGSASGLPIPGGFAASSITISDPFSCPDANSLAGPVSYISGGLVPGVGFSKSHLRLGSASGTSGISPTRGLDFGLDVYGGFGTIVNSWEVCCGAK
jgi:RHS repeat-associated protein